MTGQTSVFVRRQRRRGELEAPLCMLCTLLHDPFHCARTFVRLGHLAQALIGMFIFDPARGNQD